MNEKAKKEAEKSKFEDIVETQETLEQINEEEKVEEVISDADLLILEKDKFLRLFAEFENYKRRTSKERIELYKTANQELMTVLIPILDDFDRAVAEITKVKDKNLLKGVELIQNKFKSTLKQKGLEEIVVKSGDIFNADQHEAITIIPAPTPELKGKIVEVIEKGYKLGDKIIRFPKVITGQ
ncbi:MAG: nucleotide exchange factor GrpE [Flavobacteriaceae bacterium]|nr:nucleotide exchange factor GrpE [Flavobacteriaceae bacterium]